MADVKISALPASTTPLAGTEVLPIVQSSTTRQVSVANLTAGRAVSALSIATTTGATFATTSGSVGIGTSSPSYTLDVLNSASATLTTRIKNSNASGLSGILFDNNSSTAGASAAFNSSTNLFEFWTNSDNGFRWGYAGSSSSFTERMRITNAGNVGIGTSSPSGKLQIDSANVDPSATANGITLINSTSSQATNNGGSISLGGVYTGSSITQFSYILGAKANSTDGDYAGYLSFGTRPNGDVSQERMRITSAGVLDIGTGAGAVGQIQFPATAVPSANVNTLDDYEEGTFTPTITFGNASTGITYTTNEGFYTKIGSQVFLTGIIILSSKGAATGFADIKGFPFTVQNANGANSAASLKFNNISFSGAFQGTAPINTTQIGLTQITLLGVVTDLTDTNFSNNSSITFSVNYRV